MIAEITNTDIVTWVSVGCTVVMTLLAVWGHIKSKNWKAAGDALMTGIDQMKKYMPASERKAILKGLGAELGTKKSMVDERLRTLGLNEKA
jgi:hypothetical protein